MLVLGFATESHALWQQPRRRSSWVPEGGFQTPRALRTRDWPRELALRSAISGLCILLPSASSAAAAAAGGGSLALDHAGHVGPLSKAAKVGDVCNLKWIALFAIEIEPGLR